VAESTLDIPALQKEFFQILEEFFERATGYSVSKFAELGDFSDAIRKNAQRIGAKGPKAFSWMEENLRPYYGQRAMGAFSGAKHLGGMKLSQWN
jgi:hypothetical protein